MPNGTENKLFIDFKTSQKTDIEIYAIEIEHDEYIKRGSRFKFTFSNICAAIMFFCQLAVFYLPEGISAD